MYRNLITQLLSEGLDAHDHLLWPKMMSIHFTHLKCPTSRVCSEHTAWTTSRPQVKCWNCPVEQHKSWRLDAAVVPTFSSKHFPFTSLTEISSEKEGGTNRPQTTNICVKHLSVTNPPWDWKICKLETQSYMSYIFTALDWLSGWRNTFLCLVISENGDDFSQFRFWLNNK